MVVTAGRYLNFFTFDMDADSKSGDKSRRERRKEARLEKNKKKFDSWVDHQV